MGSHEGPGVGEVAEISRSITRSIGWTIPVLDRWNRKRGGLDRLYDRWPESLRASVSHARRTRRDRAARLNHRRPVRNFRRYRFREIRSRRRGGKKGAIIEGVTRVTISWQKMEARSRRTPVLKFLSTYFFEVQYFHSWLKVKKLIIVCVYR